MLSFDELLELYERHGKNLLVMSEKDYKRWYRILKKHPKALADLRKIDTYMTPIVLTPPNDKLRRRR